VVRDPEPAIWALTQDFIAPDGASRTRRGFLCRLRIEPYGEGRIRPHERTHLAPREDRLRLTRATRANLSPILALHSDPHSRAWAALEARVQGAAPWGDASDDEGTVHRIWRVSDPGAIAEVQAALRDAELLIADGHHRYETARAYADEIGGDGAHRYVLTCLVALEDPGLAVFPTHRLVSGLSSDQHEALANAIRRDFEVEEVSRDEVAPDGGGALQFGYMDSHFRRPFRLTLRDQAIADAALAGKPDSYRRLDTAVLEALLLKGALGMTDHDIAELSGLGYARHPAEALALLDDRSYDAAFFLRATPVEQVREVAAAGESMPPKSTFFYPKLATGLLFNPLTG
jgi:uncharacterized protein (DUF1015 family)